MSFSASSVSTYAALAIVSLTLGYWAGVGSTLNVTRRSPESAAADQPPKKNKPDGGDADGDSSDEEIGEDLSAVKAGVIEDCKLVLVVRTDLGMTSGKIAAQCSHATLACYKALTKSNPSLLRHWERTGQTKVALRCDSEDDLDLLEASARSLNLCARSIHDAGRTQIAAGSRTVLGIGPGPARLVSQVTGKLRLL